MPPDPTYPGTTVNEAPSVVRPIGGVSTSITAFVGRTTIGPTDAPSVVRSFADFERIFGGLSPACPLPYAVQHYFGTVAARP